MRSEADFASYMSARWARLVRAALLLGCSPPEAEDLVQSTLLRCYVSWDKVSASNDRDAYVYRALMNTHAQSRRRRWWRSEQPSDNEFPDVADDLTDVAHQVTSQQMLRVALGRLPVSVSTGGGAALLRGSHRAAGCPCARCSCRHGEEPHKPWTGASLGQS